MIKETEFLTRWRDLTRLLQREVAIGEVDRVMRLRLSLRDSLLALGTWAPVDPTANLEALS